MKVSAGILLFRRHGGQLEVLLVHPGGPIWAKRDAGAWSIPKGEVESGEEPHAVARREFGEETGHRLPDSALAPLGEVRQRSGKTVLAWTCQGDLDPATLVSNTFRAEWPPGSGRIREFPEVDRAGWFEPDEARRRINPAQAAFIDRLLERLQAQSNQGAAASARGGPNS